MITSTRSLHRVLLYPLILNDIKKYLWEDYLLASQA